MKKNILALLCLPALVLTAAGCSDNDDWHPGPDTAAGSMGVYFGEMSSSLVITPDDSRIIPVTIGRALADEAATVDIEVVSAPEGVVVPESVEFAKGQATAQIYIDIENMPSKSSGTVSLRLPGDVTSEYAAGTPSVSFKVTVSGAWVPVSTDVTLSTGGKYPEMKTSLYFLDGTNTFKLPDFFGSGLDLTFEMATPGNGWTRINPLSNFLDSKIAYKDMFGGSDVTPLESGWVLYNTKDDTYPDYFTPDGTGTPIDYFEVVDDYTSMQLIQDESRSGYITIESYIYYVGGEGNGWVTLTYTFTTENTPYPTE